MKELESMMIYIFVYIKGSESVQRMAVTETNGNVCSTKNRNKVCSTQKRIQMQNGNKPMLTAMLGLNNLHPSAGIR